MGKLRPVNAAIGTDLDLAVDVDVSVIVVSWNTRELLRACLASIQAGAGSICYEIIVVDNASDDGSAEMVRQEYPTVNLLVNNHNEGFAAANNRALHHARGRYVLLLNSDTVVLAGAIEQMVQYMDAHPRVGAVGPRLLNADQSVQISVYPFPHVLRDALVVLEIKRWPIAGRCAHWYGDRRNARLSATTGEVDWVMGACMMLRQEAIHEAGALDDRYFFGTEELDLCFRLRRSGWSTVYLACAEVIHLGGQSWTHVSASRLVWYHVGRLRFYRLYRGRWSYLAMRVAVAMAAFGHAVALVVGSERAGRDRRLYLSAYAHVLLLAIRPSR